MRSIVLLALLGLAAAVAWPVESPREVTLLHIGDIHGHLVPRPNVLARRGDPDHVPMEGGLARLYTMVKRLRRAHGGHTLLVSTGDAVQGSAEALFTRGGAVIDILNRFDIDAHAPGNWDFVYGTERFVETFAGAAGRPPLARWNAIAANLRRAGAPRDSVDRVLPPHLVREVNGVRVGIIGLTTERGPRAVGPGATQGFDFTGGEDEVGPIVRALRDSSRVDVVVVASELELAKNVMLGERVGGIDVILSADMHERTTRPIVTRQGTVIVEEGQDGTVLGELVLRVAPGRVQSWTFRQHVVDAGVAEDPEIARLVALARAPFIHGAGFDPEQRNPINGARLGRPLDEVVGSTTVALHRASPTGSAMPASIEGTSHDLLADAFRDATGADIGAVRGFRFGTQVAPGPITVADLYHFLPIGAQVGRAHPVGGAELRLQIESSLRGVFDPDPRLWTGGWLFGFSGITFDVDVRRPFGSRVSNVRVNGAPLDTSGAMMYAIAGLWFESEPGSVNNCGACMRPGATVEVVRDEDGEPLDAVEVVARYLRRHGPVGPHEPRVRLRHPLPGGPYGFDVLQPLPPAAPAVARRTGSSGGER